MTVALRRLEDEAEVMRVLGIMGCGTDKAIAAHCDALGGSIASRLPVVRATLRKHAHSRKIGGQRAVWREGAGPIKVTNEWALTPWSTAYSPSPLFAPGTSLEDARDAYRATAQERAA